MALNGVCRQPDQLDTAFGELRLKFGKGAQLGCANWRVVFGVGEEDDPVVTDELVEVDRTLSGFGVEVGSNAAQAQSGTRSALFTFKPHWTEINTYGGGRSGFEAILN